MNSFLKPVNDLTQFNRLVQSRKSWAYSNCYLLPDAINTYITKKNLWFRFVREGIFFFCEERDFFYLYFYLDDFLDDIHNQLRYFVEKPIVIDLVYRGDKVPEKVLQPKGFWIKNGFLEHENYRHMGRTMTDEERKEIITPNFPPGFFLSPPDRHFFYEIEHLFRTRLDIFSSPLPDNQEMACLSATGQLWCLLSPENHLVGVLCRKVSGKLNTIRQLAVSWEYQRKGFADIIVKCNLTNSGDCDHFDLWVKADNQPAITLYEKNGYRFDGKRIIQLLRK